MPFNLQPTLENEFILLRPLKQEDFESLFEVAKDPLIWEQHPADRYKREIFEKFFKESVASKGALVVIDKSSNQIIGSSRFKRIDGVDNAVEIGWSFLARKYWGGEYNKHVKTLMMNYAFEHVVDVVYYIDRNNIRSQKAVEKIGGQQLNGSPFDYLVKKTSQTLTYRINRETWKS